MAASPNPSFPARPLPGSRWLSTTLQVLACLVLVLTLAWIVWVWVPPNYGDYPMQDEFHSTQDKLYSTASILITGGVSAAVLWWLSLMLTYFHVTALGVRAAEVQKAVVPGAWGAAAETDLSERIVLLLEEINENTLLNDQDKVRKRARLDESRRERMRKEIEQLITATKWQLARARIEELAREYPDDEEVRALSRMLQDAMDEHRQVDIMTSNEQIRSYMSLGLWDRAREAAAQLTARYPEHPEAQKMADVVRMEQEGFRRDERLQLYREIEHLVNRRHYRDALKVANTLIEGYPDSSEAAALRGQLDELSRNADIEMRREMESQFIEHEKQGRHREAYEVARLLMEQYPESPQAVALKDKIDRLRELAGG